MYNYPNHFAFSNRNPINEYTMVGLSKTIGSGFAASLAVLSVSTVIIEKWFLNQTGLSSPTLLAIIGLIFSFIVVEYDELCRQIKSDWIVLLALPGVLESSSLLLSASWFLSFLSYLFSSVTEHFLARSFPSLFSLLCFLNGVGWAVFPFLGFLSLNNASFL